MSNIIDPWDWAGVVLRSRDGWLYVVEIERPEGELDIEQPTRRLPWDEEPIVGWVRTVPDGRPIAKVRISGEVKASTRLAGRDRPDWSDLERILRGTVPDLLEEDEEP